MKKKPTPHDEALHFMYDALVYSRVDFAGEWVGWRMRGRDLITPDGDRLSVGRLRWILGREAIRQASSKNRAPREDNVVTLFQRPLKHGHADRS
jgi:hypothetical protein